MTGRIGATHPCPQDDGAVGRAPAWDIAFLFLSRLGQDRQQFVFAAGGEAGRTWPVQSLSRSQASRSASRASRGRWCKPAATAAAPDRVDQPSQPGSISHIASESGPMYSRTAWASGNSIDGSLSLVAQVRERNVGDSVTLTVLRNGQRKNIDVTLVAKPTTTHNAAILLTDAVPATPSAGSQSCMAPHRAPAHGRRCVVLAIALEPVAPHTKLTGPVHESPKILGDPCDHDRRTGPDVGVVDGPEARRATPDGQPRWPDPATARALVVARCLRGLRLVLGVGGKDLFASTLRRR
jgi:hypothetical protein